MIDDDSGWTEGALSVVASRLVSQGVVVGECDG
jgi:hypothetical protein